MKSNQNFDQNIQDYSTENQAATLAVIATLITTLGDGLATIAAVLALQESQKENQELNNVNVDVQGMQRKIENLEREVKRIKKVLLSKGT